MPNAERASAALFVLQLLARGNYIGNEEVGAKSFDFNCLALKVARGPTARGHGSPSLQSLVRTRREMGRTMHCNH